MSKLAELPLAQLSVSKLNVRKHGPREIETLAKSIRVQGLLQPLIVRPAAEGFEVLAGSRRLKALQRIAEEDGNTGTVPAVVLDAGDDGAAIAASLAENIERLPMDELDQYTAFAALIREGHSDVEISQCFGVTVQTVRRRLALAKLIPDIHRLYRAGEIDSDTLKLLTLATREKQKAYVAALRDADNTPLPPRWQLKAWLLGGSEIETTAALFDETLYKGDIAGDLFGSHRYFTDIDEFWRLQNEAIAKLKSDLSGNGWPVEIVPPSDPFYVHQWEAVKKADGGAAIIEVRPNGVVEIHKGLIRATDANKRRATALRSGGAATATGTTTAPDSRPEMSEALANYCDLIRLASVRLELLNDPKTALRLLVAHLMGRASHIRVTVEPATAKTDTAKDAFDKHPGTIALARARLAACDAFELSETSSIVADLQGDDRTALIFDKLLTTDDKSLMKLVAVVMAETIALGSDIVDVVGTMFETQALDHWKPDGAFLELVRDREATDAMLVEVIGADPAKTYTTDTGKKKREIIAKALTGKARTRVDGWCPKYMTFPQATYTTRRKTAQAGTKS